MFPILIAAAFAQALTPAPTPPTAPPSPVFVAAPAPTNSGAPRPSLSAVLPPCALAKIAPATVLDSKTAEPGQSFKFVVSSIDDPGHAFSSIATGTEGWGVIAVVRHGRTGGDPGLLVLEARYVIGLDGKHVPVELVRSLSGLFMGKSHNSPGVLGWIPWVGYVSSAYDAFHKGGDILVGPNEVLTIALGDDPVVNACSLPTPAP
jgi:hypothetical protein